MTEDWDERIEAAVEITKAKARNIKDLEGIAVKSLSETEKMLNE